MLHGEECKQKDKEVLERWTIMNMMVMPVGWDKQNERKVDKHKLGSQQTIVNKYVKDDDGNVNGGVNGHDVEQRHRY
jgi:hypothetical protein